MKFVVQTYIFVLKMDAWRMYLYRLRNKSVDRKYEYSNRFRIKF